MSVPKIRPQIRNARLGSDNRLRRLGRSPAGWRGLSVGMDLPFFTRESQSKLCANPAVKTVAECLFEHYDWWFPPRVTMPPTALRVLEFERVVDSVAGFALTPMGESRLRA